MRCTSGPFPLVFTCPKEKAAPASDVAAVLGGTSVAGMATVNSTSGSVAGADPDEEVGVASAVLFLPCLASLIF